MLDAVSLTQALIRCPSVTPADAGALDVVAAAAAAAGFAVHRLAFDGTPNLFAHRPGSGARLCFAGHTDVVPPGAGDWSCDPFGGSLRDGAVWGRGACDMKGAVAAFLAAASAERQGAASLLITGDEEGPATGGTVRVLEWMQAHGHVPEFCLVGEPTNPARLGEAVKVGRRGSLNAVLTVQGVQGHVAYPDRVDNPVHRLVRLLAALLAEPLDAGTEWFEPSGVQVTSVDVGNPAANLVPAAAVARLNIRFNDRHTGASLEAWLREAAGRHAGRFALEVAVSGEAFLTQPGALAGTLTGALAGTLTGALAGTLAGRLLGAVESVTGLRPRLDTGGGTSDARFIARCCPVVEFGLVGATMHAVDEHVSVADLLGLTDIYRAVLRAFAA